MRFTTLPDSLGSLQPGERVFVPGSSGAPTVWMDALLTDTLASRGVAITTTYVPGINPLKLDALHASAQIFGLFAHADRAAPRGPPSLRHLPVSYGGFLRELEAGPAFDVAVVQVSPPDRQGMCSLGPAVEFSLAVLARARRRIAVINAGAPALRNSCAVPVDRFSELVQGDAALPDYVIGGADPVASAIARHVQEFVPDDATVQIGIGKIPAAVLAALGDRRGLKFHSGMLTDGLIRLQQQGALAANHQHTACALLGSQVFYQWAAEQQCIRIRGCEFTHAPSRLAALERFIAINSALEVDLFGQCNAEFLAGRAISGPGGAPDFAAAARRCASGVSIVALPASSHGVSRIRARLDVPATLARTDVDVVITEHGVADLRGASVQDRAERLISVAMPAARSDLASAWKG